MTTYYPNKRSPITHRIAPKALRQCVFCAALLTAGMLGAAASLATPVGPGEPGYCSEKHDAIACQPQIGPPSLAEIAFVREMHDIAPAASPADLVKVARGTCSMLIAGDSVNYIVPDIASHLGLSSEAADQVMDAAMDEECPGLTIGASGAAHGSTPWHLPNILSG